MHGLGSVYTSLICRAGPTSPLVTDGSLYITNSNEWCRAMIFVTSQSLPTKICNKSRQAIPGVISPCVVSSKISPSRAGHPHM